MGITVHSGLRLIMEVYILLGLFVSANAQMGYPMSTEYIFEPDYDSHTLSGVPTRPGTFSWDRMVLARNSKVRCVPNTRSTQGGTRETINDACRDFEHNNQLISAIRCNNCRYVAAAPRPGEAPQPRLDYSTCNCRIESGEMVEGQGSLMRNDDGTVRTLGGFGGLQRRYMPEYRLVRRNEDDEVLRQSANTANDLIRVVCNRDANGKPRNDEYDQCHVELTIEQCSLVNNDGNPVANEVDAARFPDPNTGRPVRQCYLGTNPTEDRDGSYTPDSNGNLVLFPQT